MAITTLYYPCCVRYSLMSTRNDNFRSYSQNFWQRFAELKLPKEMLFKEFFFYVEDCWPVIKTWGFCLESLFTTYKTTDAWVLVLNACRSQWFNNNIKRHPCFMLSTYPFKYFFFFLIIMYYSLCFERKLPNEKKKFFFFKFIFLSSKSYFNFPLG